MTEITDSRTAFPSRWLKCEDLEDSEVVLTISSYKREEMRNPRTGGTELKPVLWFSEIEKGLIANRTISDAVTELHGHDVGKWRGLPVCLYPTETESGGKVWPVIRVKAAPVGTPTPSPEAAVPCEQASIPFS